MLDAADLVQASYAEKRLPVGSMGPLVFCLVLRGLVLDAADLV